MLLVKIDEGCGTGAGYFSQSRAFLRKRISPCQMKDFFMMKRAYHTKNGLTR
jgi:hypothetical protein